MATLIAALSLLAIVLITLILWQQLDRRADARIWSELRELAAGERETFDHGMVAGLPEPAQRYFTYTIAVGTPLRSAFRIEMTGQIGMGTQHAPNYQPMQATQILAPPYGLVWRLKAGPLQGSDGATPDGSWTRFWLFGLLPVVRASGLDHHRSAFGRVVAEAAFWSPASLLPSDTVQWEAVGPDTARAVVQFGEFTQAVEITVDEDGEPTEAVILRWSNENAEKAFREQPFGGYPSEYRWFDGYKMPTRVEGGNHFGAPAFFPFFIANVTEIEGL